MSKDDKIYYLKDQTKENMGEWIVGLNASGYAGTTKSGLICDRREFPNAIPIPENSLFGIVKSKKIDNE